MKGQDTCELFFENVRVPKTNILGAPGMGFAMLMKELAWERLQIAIGAVCGIEYALKTTIEYVKQRQVFGRAVASYQNTRFKLAELNAEGQIAQVYVERCNEREHGRAAWRKRG